MTDRFFIAMCAAVALASQAPIPVVAQADTEHRTLPRTPWGDSDLQGVWNNNASTPLERPAEFAEQAFLSVEERAAYTARRQASREDRDSREARGTDADVRRAYNAHWYPVPGEAINRTSLILNPPDGKIPPLTPAGQQRADARRRIRQNSPAGPEDRSLWERCLTRGVPRTPGSYNNHFQIFRFLSRICG